MAWLWTWNGGRPMTTGDDPGRTAEVVEAEVRQRMAEHAAIKPRGWQTMKDREILHRRIDKLLDEWAMRMQVEAVTQ